MALNTIKQTNKTLSVESGVKHHQQTNKTLSVESGVKHHQTRCNLQFESYVPLYLKTRENQIFVLRWLNELGSWIT